MEVCVASAEEGFGDDVWQACLENNRGPRFSAVCGKEPACNHGPVRPCVHGAVVIR
jgi:hypothetical protein